MSYLSQRANRLLSKFGVQIKRSDYIYKSICNDHSLDMLKKYIRSSKKCSYEKGFVDFLINHRGTFYSQVCQDLMCLYFLNYPVRGTFVEVGVGNGVLFSNSYLLEKIGWSGILVEPNRSFHKNISKTRNAKLWKIAASSEEGEVSFTDTYISELSYTGEVPNDGLERKIKDSYKVECRRLDFMLSKSGIGNIDYLSIDVEGHELNVLDGFDIDFWKPKVVSVEINGDRKKLDLVKQRFGDSYSIVLNELSSPDVWLIENETLGKLGKDYFQ